MSNPICLENEFLKVSLHAIGAELQSVFNKASNLEYMWQAEPTVWARHSPVLFPIVGRLKDDTYNYNGKEYKMGQHGFARNKAFQVIAQTPTMVSFQLSEDEETLAIYPFKFSLTLSYILNEQELTLQYEVKNTDTQSIYFSIGAHPGFRLPLFDNEQYEDYFISFNQAEKAESYLIDGGLISNQTKAVFINPNQLNLNKEIFLQDALVFKNLHANTLTLRSKNHAHGLSLAANHFPFYGIWAQKNADFVCLEPWCGIADPVSGQSSITQKEGINCLAESENFVRMLLFHFF
jgi:galactose mutarotase-like enzyme